MQSRLLSPRPRSFYVFEIETRKFRDLLVETETKQLRDRDSRPNRKQKKIFEIEIFLLNSGHKTQKLQLNRVFVLSALNKLTLRANRMIAWPDMAEKANHFDLKLVLPVQVEKKRLTSEMKDQIHCLKKVKIQTHLLWMTKIHNYR